MIRYSDIVRDAAGNVLEGAEVTVKLAGTATLADLFSDDGVTPTANPTTTDSNGLFAFYIDAGDYDISVTKTGYGTFAESDVSIGDIGTRLAVTYVPSGTTTIPADGRHDVFTATAATGGTTWAFTTTAPAGVVSGFVLELTDGGSQTQTWPAGTQWTGGTEPSLTAAGKDVLVFYTYDGGATWVGVVAGLDVKEPA